MWLLIVGLAGGCDGTETNGSATPRPLVTQLVNVVNHATGLQLGSLTFPNVLTGSSISVDAALLAVRGVALSTVGTRYMVARVQPMGGRVGELLSKTETASIAIPVGASPITLYLMNAVNGTDYGCILTRVGDFQFGQQLPYGRFVDVRRLRPGSTGLFRTPRTTIVDWSVEDSVPLGLEILNAAFLVEAVAYSSLRWTPDSSSAALGGGYARILSKENGRRIQGLHNGNNFVINDENKVPASRRLLAAVEAAEAFLGGDDMCGIEDFGIFFPKPTGGRVPEMHRRGLDRLTFSAIFAR